MIEIALITIVSPPRLHLLGTHGSSPENRKTQHKQHRQTGTIKSTRHQITIILEDPWFIVSQVELDKETGEDLTKDGRGLRGIVGYETAVLEELGEV